MGLYHPHVELHHIKKENIGLIEVMGLAVLPARLKDELAAVTRGLVSGADLRADERTAKHADWAEGFRSDCAANPLHAQRIVEQQVGLVFAGVYGRNIAGKAAFLKFAEQVKLFELWIAK